MWFWLGRDATELRHFAWIDKAALVISGSSSSGAFSVRCVRRATTCFAPRKNSGGARVDWCGAHAVARVPRVAAAEHPISSCPRTGTTIFVKFRL